MSFRGSRPRESELITIAGRVLRIAAPTVGSKLTRQISPRFGKARSIVNEISFEKLAPLRILLVVRDHLIRLLSK